MIETTTGKSTDKHVAKEIQITEFNDATLVGKRITVEGLISEVSKTPYVGYQEVEMTCHPSESKSHCQVCPHMDTGSCEKKIDIYNSKVINFIGLNDAGVRTVLKDMVNIPLKCGSAKFSAHVKKVNLYRALAIPNIDFIGEADKNKELLSDSLYDIQINIVFMDINDVEDNNSYRMTGVIHRDPTDGRLVLLCDKADPVIDDIKGFKMDKEMYDRLSRFKAEEDTADSVRARAEAILKEQRVNHHKIKGRENMAYFMNMVFHSVLGFTWQGSVHNRGWLDGAIVGDSRTGKSEMVRAYVNMFKLGYVVPGNGVSYAGAIGGMNKSGIKESGLQVKWGLLVKNDGGFVAWDEAHMENCLDIWPKMNDTRASGIASIDKIGTSNRRMPARVRKLFIANPPDGKVVADYNYPCQMMKGIFSTSECIARSDFLIVPRSIDVTGADMKCKEETVEDYYMDGRHRDLLRFIWSRTPDQVIFEEDCEEFINHESLRLNRKYDSVKVPLFQLGEGHFTLARGAAAQAGSVFSTSYDGQKIVVKRCHAEVYIKALEDIYASEAVNYEAYSFNIHKKTRFLNSEDFFDICCEVRGIVDNKKANSDVLREIMDQGELNSREFKDFWDIGDDAYRKLNACLSRRGLIEYIGNKQAKFFKTRKGILVFKYILSAERNLMFIDEASCKEYFQKVEEAGYN